MKRKIKKKGGRLYPFDVTTPGLEMFAKNSEDE